MLCKAWTFRVVGDNGGFEEGMVQMGMKGKLKPDKNRKPKVSCPDASKPEA